MIFFLNLFLFPQLLCASIKFHFFSPERLSNYYKSNELQINIANYGYIPYGQSLIGNLEFANPKNACLPLTSPHSNRSDPYPIVVIERGGCHFVTKTHYAQIYGARMVILIDNVVESVGSLEMIDDGYGFDIHIPTILIPKLDGELINSFILEGSNVAASFEFIRDHIKNFVELEFWMSANDQKSYEFLINFRSYLDKIGSQLISFRPRYALWFCPSCKLGNSSFSSENCISNGKYCIPNSETKNLKSIMGKDIVLEDLTQICLFKLSEEKWWDYIKDFYETCVKLESKQMDLKKCSDHILTLHGFNKTRVEICINDSFVRVEEGKSIYESDNILLNQEQNLFMAEGIQSWPALRINNETFRERLLPVRNPLSRICDVLQTKVKVCEDEFEKAKTSSNKSPESGVSIVTFIVVSVVVIVLLVFVMLLFYQRKIRREMASELQNQVNSHLSKYFSLDGEKKSAVV